MLGMRRTVISSRPSLLTFGHLQRLTAVRPKIALAMTGSPQRKQVHFTQVSQVRHLVLSPNMAIS